MTTDVNINLPTELFDVLSEVIRAGLIHAKITNKEKQDIVGWWDAESSFIIDKLQDSPNR